MLQIKDQNVLPGKKTAEYIGIDGTNIKLPITLIAGKNPGPTVLITAGVHCAEYVSIQTAIELSSELEPEDIHGDIILLPLMNPTGFEQRSMSLVPEDGKNLNRVFPGSADGTLSDKIAYTVVRHLQSKADYYIDLHGGDGFESLTPYVYYAGAAAPEVSACSKAMAEQVNVPYLVRSATATGGAYNYAASCGIPSILIERGCMGAWNPFEVVSYKEDVYRILHHLGVWTRETAPKECDSVELHTVFYPSAGQTGCWYPCFRPGDSFKKGDRLGEIKDYFGNTLETYAADTDGILLYQVGSLCVLKGDTLLAYGESTALVQATR